MQCVAEVGVKALPSLCERGERADRKLYVQGASLLAKSRVRCSPVRQGLAIVTGLYLTSFTVIPDTARRKSTPCPTPVRLMTTPLSFRIDDAPIPPPTVPDAVAATYVPGKSLIFFKL